MERDVIDIRHPGTGVPQQIPAERIALGLPGDYKPNVALMPDGGLLLAAFRTNSDNVGEGYREDILLFGSHDDGRSWSSAQVLGKTHDLLGREPYLTVLRDGTILITCHFLKAEVRNDLGYVANFIHRSADEGRTWSTVEVLSERLPKGTEYGTTRNILERADGTLLLVVTVAQPVGAFLWVSSDGGATWREKGNARVIGLPKGYPYGVFAESRLLQVKSGRLIMISRVDHRYYPIAGRNISHDELDVINRLLAGYGVGPVSSITSSSFDQFEHLKIFTSDDEGATWQPGPNIGDYGMMYPSVLRLDDRRILLTFTVRQVSPPLGVRAVLGKETDEGLQFDFDHNLFVVDDKTPLDRHSGGGFGNTVRVGDDSLLTPYSYRGDDGKTYMEVARWRLPDVG